MSNLVSIVMPVYNSEKFLNDSINDILKQTYKNFEFILIDDGSTDKSLEIIKSFAEKDSRIKFFTKNNGGTGSALNLGFSKASGKYATWVSSDDKKYPNFIESLVNILDNNEDCKFVFSAFDEYVEGNFNSKIYRKLFPLEKTGPLDNFLDISNQYCITGICFLFYLDLKNLCGKYEEYPGEDYVMGVKMGTLTKVYATTESLGAHCLHKESLTVKNPSCVVKANNEVKKFIDRIKKI
jgi:glycosyltransferase involved in cell wall biosynthesis